MCGESKSLFRFVGIKEKEWESEKRREKESVREKDLSPREKEERARENWRSQCFAELMAFQ